MNALFPAQLPNQLLLVMGEHAASHWMLELAAWLSMQGPVRVLDGAIVLMPIPWRNPFAARTTIPAWLWDASAFHALLPVIRCMLY